MLVGEAPGEMENRYGTPFVGPAGQELDRFLRQAGIKRAQVYITNLCKVWPEKIGRKQLPPTPEEIERDRPELEREISDVMPSVIVPIGSHAAKYFLGSKFRLRGLHGIPIPGENGVVYLPAYHPAAGLHAIEQQKDIQFDFQQLGRFLRGEIAPPVDEYPEPIYTEYVDSPPDSDGIEFMLAGETLLAMDTEGHYRNPWGLSITAEEGAGYIVRINQPESLALINQHINAYHGVCSVVFHYAVHDLRVLEPMGITIPPERLEDTMIMAYLLGTEPQGLKDLARRHCGMEMSSYEDLTREAEDRISQSYVKNILDSTQCPVCWGDGKYRHDRKDGKGLKKNPEKCQFELCTDGHLIPPTPESLEWDSATGEVRVKKPWSLARRLKRAYESATTPDDPADDDDESDEDPSWGVLRKKWETIISDIPDVAYELTQRFGHMPETTLDDVEDQEAVVKYSARDADATLRVRNKLMPKIKDWGLVDCMRMDTNILPMLRRMEDTGMQVDTQYFRDLTKKYEGEMDSILYKLQQLVGKHTNPYSGPQVAELLFGDLGLEPIKLTKSGEREAVDDKVLQTISSLMEKREADPIAQVALDAIHLITEYREINKLRGTYTVPIVRYADANSRVHTRLKYTRAATGRLASEGPNLMNIPTRTERGRDIRMGFNAPRGTKLVAIDYAQIEMVILAIESGDANLLRCFREGLDLHTMAASMMFSVPYDEVTKDMRSSSKNLNFGIAYGISAIGLQAQFALRGIHKTEEECQALIELYFEKFAPGVRAYMEKIHSYAIRHGYVRDMFGRIRHVPAAQSRIDRVRSAALREAGNFPIQAGAQGVIKTAMAKVWDLMPLFWNEGVHVECLIQVHDELVFEIEESALSWVVPMLENEMKYAVNLPLPLNAEAAIGDYWGELKSGPTLDEYLAGKAAA